MKILVILFFIFHSFQVFSKTIELDTLVALKVGDDVTNFAKSYKSEKFNYDIESKDNKLISIDIYFDLLIESEKYVKKDQKGFCLAQPARGDFILYRFYFFDETLQKRYEVSKDLKIKSINIQDFSLANKHRRCKFEEVIKIENENKLRKIK